MVVNRVLVYEKAHHTLANYKKRMIALVVSIYQRRKNEEGKIERHSVMTPDPPGPQFPRLGLQDGGLKATAYCCVHLACTGLYNFLLRSTSSSVELIQVEDSDRCVDKTQVEP